MKGWNGFHEKAFGANYNDKFFYGRVISKTNQYYKLICKNGEITLINQTISPVIGDYVVIKKDNPEFIHSILPRSSNFLGNAGNVLAANFDSIFIVYSLVNLNVKEVEKTILKAWESGAVPVLVLTNLDQCNDYHKVIAEVKLYAQGADVFAYSDLIINELTKYLKPDKTVMILGSFEDKKDIISKYNLIENELTILPNDSLVISVGEEKEIDQNYLNEVDYTDVEELVKHCRFSNCTHSKEPGCALVNAIEAGKLDEKRVHQFYKKQKQKIELIIDETIHFEYKKRPKELYNKGRRKEQW